MIVAHPLITTRTPPTKQSQILPLQVRISRVFNLFTPKSRIQHHAPILFPTSTMALNPPPLKLYDCANFALDDINEFAKGQGYAVSKFCLKVDKQILPTVRKISLASIVYLEMWPVHATEEHQQGCGGQIILSGRADNNPIRGQPGYRIISG